VNDNNAGECPCLFHQLSAPAPVNQHQQLLPVQLVSMSTVTVALQVDMIVPVMRLMTVLLHTSVEVN